MKNVHKKNEGTGGPCFISFRRVACALGWLRARSCWISPLQSIIFPSYFEKPFILTDTEMSLVSKVSFWSFVILQLIWPWSFLLRTIGEIWTEVILPGIYAAMKETMTLSFAHPLIGKKSPIWGSKVDLAWDETVPWNTAYMVECYLGLVVKYPMKLLPMEMFTCFESI